SDAQNNTTSTPNAASVTDADKVINTKIDSTQIEDKNEEELLKGLLTDDYCHVCEAVLLFESQRLSHYEGKKHAQKLKVYLQAKKGEKINKFCELCNMVFSSHLVAKSHYEGKVHAKNLRKQGLQPPGKAATTAPSTEVDLKDPNKCCALCAASFNNPQMALQHYNGRKHQRNQARQELMKELGDNVQQNSLVCQMCSVQFNSVEMYQAHVQGNKHQIEKKVVDLCKSQQKSYSTFADELADYIQVQKARGINPKTSQVLPQGDTQKEDEEDEEEVQEVFNKEHIIELSKPVPNLPPASDAPHQFGPGCYYPAEGWRPPYPGPPRLPHGWDYNCPPPGFSASGAPQFAGRPIKRKSRRTQSSSSSCTTSSSYSSSYSSSNSSSTSDSDDNKYKRRERRRIRRSRKERGRRSREEDSHKEERRRKRQRKERDNESEERKKEEFGESQQERRRNKQKKHGKQRRKEKKSREEEEGGERVMDNLKPEDMMDNRKYTEVHIQAEINVEQGEGGQDESAKPKYRREKKKVKEKVDTRTEEEKLWDDS
uniref:Zinc finger matrin-type 1 n=1 Tax=Seriola lalandi dorsalis TaxID=1841481 RepID=A0A3B4Y4M6_SERLL